nr:unnamed protein product [Callosobruchus analis]
MEKERRRYLNTQKKKIEKLTSIKKSTLGLNNRTVVNISKRNMSEKEISVFAKGGNFVITPKQITTAGISNTICT